MMDDSATDRGRHTREYLEATHSLLHELERAMLAISRNGLTDLEESLAAQELLTLRLRGLRPQSSVFSDTQPECLRSALDKEMATELVRAQTELQAVNRVYDAVLGYSTHSAALMKSLLGSGQGKFQEASGSRSKYQTWSCRM